MAKILGTRKLEFGKLKYHKSGIFLISSEIAFFCCKFLKMVVFGHFHPYFLPANENLGFVLTSQPFTGPENYLSWA